MAPKSFKQLIAQGLAALQAGSQIAAGATAEIQQAAPDSRLKLALDQGADTSARWAARIDRALAEAGGAGEQHNPILEAHYQVSQQIRQQAPNDLARDLGIIAASHSPCTTALPPSARCVPTPLRSVSLRPNKSCKPA